jgi:hypothetical protein
MIVPRYWAEYRLERSHAGKKAVFRRWGWSDESEAAALRHGETRARDAFHAWTGGFPSPRREPKVAYNGAEGVPIREEIVDRIGSTVVTRNGYGALCLNTPDVLFADMDLVVSPPESLSCLLTLLFMGLGVWTAASWGVGWVLAGAALLLGIFRGQMLARDIHLVALSLRGGITTEALRRVERFVAAHPDWGIRVYRTPNGLRLLVTQTTFDPRSDAVRDFFTAIKADPIFCVMCRRQNCFRARLTPKPWRIGVTFQGWSSRRGVWPVTPESLAARHEWVARYDVAREEFAACEYVTTVGSAEICPAAREVVDYHDDICRAHRGLALA